MKYPHFGIRIALAFLGFSIPGLATSSAVLAQGSLPANSLPANAMPSNTLPALSPPLPPAYPTPAYPMGAYPMPAHYPASEPPVSMLMNGLLAEYQASQDEERKKQIVERITQLVQKQFDQTHSMQQQEIKTLEALLAQKKKRIEKREAIKDKIVTDRVAALVQKAEGTGWESDGQPFPSGYALPAIPPAIPPAWTPVGNAPASFPPPQPANPIYSSPAGFSPTTQPPAGLIPPASPVAPPISEFPLGAATGGPTSGAQVLFGAQTADLPIPFQLPSQTAGEYPKARVSYEDFKELVAEVEPHRSARILSLDQFLQMSKQPNVMVLDTRSAFRYERIHIQGAKHLSFTDFTQANLAGVIPTPETTVLIYCNNNFDGNQIDFASKSAPARPSSNRGLGSQVASQEKPVQLALNVPTYINLYGYGYQNVYELGELVKVTDPRIQFEGTMVGKNK